MAALTDYAANRLLDFFRGQTLTPPVSNWYAAAFTVAPTHAGGGTEPTGNGYARVAIGANLVAWNGTQGGGGSVSSGTSQLISNVAAVIFPKCVTTPWGDIVAVGLFDASSNGNLWIFDAVTPPFYVAVGKAPRFNQQSFSFSFIAHDPL